MADHYLRFLDDVKEQQANLETKLIELLPPVNARHREHSAERHIWVSLLVDRLTACIESSLERVDRRVRFVKDFCLTVREVQTYKYELLEELDPWAETLVKLRHEIDVLAAWVAKQRKLAIKYRALAEQVEAVMECKLQCVYPPWSESSHLMLYDRERHTLTEPTVNASTTGEKQRALAPLEVDVVVIRPGHKHGFEGKEGTVVAAEEWEILVERTNRKILVTASRAPQSLRSFWIVVLILAYGMNQSREASSS